MQSPSLPLFCVVSIHQKTLSSEDRYSGTQEVLGRTVARKSLKSCQIGDIATVQSKIACHSYVS